MSERQETIKVAVGEQVQVRTRDGHVYRGELLEIRYLADGRELGVIRLDTGWVTSYPLTMIWHDG
jgi:hypothetical protein